jgi:hypothetical protein
LFEMTSTLVCCASIPVPAIDSDRISFSFVVTGNQLPSRPSRPIA